MMMNFDVEPLNYDGETIIKMPSDIKYILKLMNNNIGVLGGYFEPGKLHSVMWDRNYILNPANELIYTLDEFKLETFYMLKSLWNKVEGIKIEPISTKDTRIN